MKNSNCKLNYFYFFSGFFFILYIIYIRLIMVRLPKDLSLFQNGMFNTKLFVMIIIGVSFSISLLLLNLYFLKNNTIKQGFLSKYLSIFSDFIQRSVFEVYRSGELFISNGYTKISFLAEKFYTIFGNKTEELLIYVNFFIRFLIVSVFLFDVFYFFQLNYFYKILVFLCIPICINVLMYILTNFSKNLEEIKASLTITDLGIDKETNLPQTRYAPSPGFEDINLAYYVKQFIICNKIYGYLRVYHVLLRYISIRCNIVIYSLYLLGWLFILYKNIFLL